MITVFRVLCSAFIVLQGEALGEDHEGPKLHVFAFADHVGDYLATLSVLVRQFGSTTPLNVLGLGSKKDDEEGSGKFHLKTHIMLAKHTHLLKAINDSEIPEDDIVLFVDGFDTFIQRDLRELITELDLENEEGVV